MTGQGVGKRYRRSPLGTGTLPIRGLASRLLEGAGSGGAGGGIEARDVDDLLQISHKKSKAALRHLSFTGGQQTKGGHLEYHAGSGQRQQPQQHMKDSATGRSGVGLQLLSSASSPSLPPLQTALTDGPSAESTRQQIRRDRRGLLEDHATVTISQGGSLTWIDMEGLAAEQQAMATSLSSSMLQTQDQQRLITKQASQLRGRRSLFEERMHRMGVAPAQQATQRNPGGWVALSKFENHYHPPLEDLLPNQPMASTLRVSKPAPQGYRPRETVSRLEDIVSPGLELPMWTAHLATAQSATEARRAAALGGGRTQGTGTVGGGGATSIPQGAGEGAAGVFEAVAIYRKACAQVGVEALRPVPIFGEVVEIRGDGCEDTRQCYALAEGLRAHAPKGLILEDVALTDSGATRVVEIALGGERLQELVITKSWLGFRTIVALHASLKTRAGGSLTKLVIQECGCGSNLEVDVDNLPAHEREIYLHCLTEPEPLMKSTGHRGSRIMPLRISMDASLQRASGMESSGQENTARSNSSSSFGGQSDHSDGWWRSRDDESRWQLGKPSAQSLSEVDESGAAESSSRHESSIVLDRQMSDGVVTYREVALEELALPHKPVKQPVPLLLPLLYQLPHATCSLHHLDLSWNLLSKEAGLTLGKYLGASQLEVVFLSHCGIGDEALTALAHGFAENSTLMNVKLRCNALSGDVLPMVALLNAAGRHPRLAHLDIAENVIGKGCSEELCSAFRWSCSLVAIHLLGTGSGPDAHDIAEVCTTWAASHGESPCSSIYSNAKTKEVEEEQSLFKGLEHPEMVLCRALHARGLDAWRVTEPLPPLLPLRSYPEEGAVAPSSYMPAGCWVCNACSAVNFEYRVPDHGPGSASGALSCKLFVRPSFSGFQRIELRRERSDKAPRVAFSSKLLVPPGEHCYLFEAVYGPRHAELLSAHGQHAVEQNEVSLEAPLREGLQAFCRARNYTGAVNVLPVVSEKDFHIPEALELPENDEEIPVCDPWATDAIRKQRLEECLQADLPRLQLTDLCHVLEEGEVKQTISELYTILYETYAIYGGRSLWPMVRQVDVYAFFDEAQILMDSPFATDLEPPKSDSDSSSPRSSSPWSKGGTAEWNNKVYLQDVQQILVQTIGSSSSNGNSASRGRELHSEGSSSTEADTMATSTLGQSKFSRKCTQTNASLRERAVTVVERHREGAPITRPQFIEVLLRAAVATRSRELSTAKCMRRFVKHVLLGRIMQPPLSPFPRGLIRQGGDVRNALLAHRKMLIEAFERFACSDASFQRFAQLLRLCDRTFTAKHVSSIFTLVKLPVVDASTEPLRRGLGYDEFCEAVAWLSTVWQRGRSRGHARRDPKQRFRAAVKASDQPLNQKQFALHLEAFLQKMRQRMLPSSKHL